MRNSNDTSRWRITLAATVAAACLLAITGIAQLIPGAGAESGPPTGEGLTKAAASPEPSHRHSRDVGVPGMREARLREIETVTLGPAHAREHAMLRRALRRKPAGSDQAGTDAQVASAAAAAPGAADSLDPAEVGRWGSSPAVTFPIVAIHTAVLPTGKVMVFSFEKSPYTNSAQVWLWDPATGEKVRKDPPLWQDPADGNVKSANIWCSGHTFTADGELVVFGGNLAFEGPTTNYKGLNKVYTFNPFTETWREQPDMRHGRWYPTGVRLADGRIPILSGWDESGTKAMNTDVELFTPAPALGGLGTTTLIGATGGAGQPPTGEYYPHMFSMPSGRALVVGPNTENSWFFDNVQAPSFAWSEAPDLIRRRTWGTAVPMPRAPQKIMALGGTDWSVNPSTTATEVFDESNPGLGWQAAKPNVIGRGHANTVLLPDGSMVQVGGGIGSKADAPSPQHAANPEQRQIELWDPATGEWRLGPAQLESRAYHSTAVLLPDGRVLSAGDDWNGGIESDTGEIYEPPYLFRGDRPTITSAPPTIKVGASFGVQTPNTNIKRAALVAPSAVTHAVDMNQRLIPLQVTQRSGCVDLVAPPNVHAAPPGYYMLFLLNDQGIPSVAKFVKLQTGGSAATCNAPLPPADTTAPSISVTTPSGGATVSGAVNVRATASDNIGVAGVRFKLDGANLGAEDTSSPYSTTWNTTQVENGTHDLTAVARDATGNTRTSNPVTITVANAGPDTTAPTVSLTAPAAGSTVTGTTDLIAQASDNVAVEAVQFQVDGANLGPEDNSAPYSVQWNSTDVPNGSHTLSARARDTAGNTQTSAAHTVTVSNAPPPAEPTPVEPGPGTPPSGPGPATAETQPPGSPPSGPADYAPVLSGLKVSPASFRKRTSVSFRLSEAAKVGLSFERKLAGQTVRGKRYIPLKRTLTVQGKAGANRVSLTRRLSAGRSVESGRYRVIALATDATGKRSAPARTSLRLLRPAKRRAKVVSLIRGPIGGSGVFG
jgi:hypothetical protein